MNEKQVQIESYLTLADAAAVTQYVDKEVLARIKKYDDAPVFAMMTIGYEGESTGALYNAACDKIAGDAWYKQIWPLKAVKELVSKLLSKEVPVFANQHHVKGNDTRTRIGTIVASTKKVINNLTHAIGIAYISDIPTRVQLQNGELNACSMESKCLFTKAENAVNWIVDTVTDVLGVVLFNKELIEPGFKDASIHAVITAMSDSQEKGKTMEITLEDVKKYIENNKLGPTSLFSVETITRDAKIKDVLDNEIKISVKGKDDEIHRLNAELSPLKQKLGHSAIVDLIGKSDKLKNESKLLVDYLKKIIKMDTSKEVTKEQVDAEIDIQLSVIKDSGITFAVKENKEEDKGKENKGTDDGNKGKETILPQNQYIDSKTNDLIPA